MKTMMIAKKPFRKNKYKKIPCYFYLSSMTNKRKGFGALEHPTVVLPEMMPREELVKSMKDVVSHEFFHIVTPFILKKSIILIIIHQKMSEHLWMYEGVTEYFAIFSNQSG
jgi:predicted metalloprotease with PDZ domain